MNCPLDEYYEKEDWWRAETKLGETGWVIGWSRPIELACPIKTRNGDITEVGGWWIFLNDRDKSKGGIHPTMIRRI